MNRQIINIVWLKRDIRSQDHEPLLKAERAGIPYRIVYLFEPDLIDSPDTSLRHLQFIYHSIIALNKTLFPFKRNVDVYYGNANDVFTHLSECFEIKNIFSFRESGTKITWNRDKRISSLFSRNKISWGESQRDGILRGIKNRINWSDQWHQTMHTTVIRNSYSVSEEASFEHPFLLPETLEVRLKEYPQHYQPAGEQNAWRYLQSFTNKRGFFYQKHISGQKHSFGKNG